MSKKIKLIADAGSTKTDWALIGADGRLERISTQGINPFHQSPEVIQEICRTELLPQLPVSPRSVGQLYFYGSGCTVEKISVVKEALKKNFPALYELEVDSDLLGAARAVCGHDEGLACILGTGSNACLYNGQTIEYHIPPLGYILGDEGSGTAIGKSFLNGIYKGSLPPQLRTEYETFSGLTLANVIDKVYRQPLANRFLASVSLFVARHLDVPELSQMVVQNFQLFLQNNIKPYGRDDLRLGVVGGLSTYYRTQLEAAAAAENIRLGQLMKNPIEGLLNYHLYRKR